MVISSRTYFFISLLAIATLLVPSAITLAAEGETGNIVIEQEHTTYRGIERIGSWGLTMPSGIIRGESKAITLKKKPFGNYILTIQPPDGVVATIEVYYDDDETPAETFESRNASGKLEIADGTLRFVVIYSYDLIGNVSVNSKPSGIPFDLRGPVETVKGETPAYYPDRVAGTYTVYYKLPGECRPVAPISRIMKSGGRLGFSTDFTCSVFDEDTSSPTTDEDDEEDSEEEEKSTPLRRTTQSPVRVSLSISSSEVTAGGTARYTVIVLNRSDTDLENLTAEYRYDSSSLFVNVRDGEKTGSTVRWNIASLPAGAKWQKAVSAVVSDGSENGTVLTTSVTVAGDDLSGVRASKRTDSAKISVIRELPQTGVGSILFELYALLGFVVTSFFSLAVSGVRGWVR